MTQENQDRIAETLTAAVVEAIQKQQAESAASTLDMERAASKFIGIRDIIAAVGFFVALIGGGTLAFSELQAKPSELEMRTAIDARVAPIEMRVAPIESSVSKLADGFERMQALQEITMQHAEWRAEVADCRAKASCKRIKGEPQSLKDKKRALMTRGGE